MTEKLLLPAPCSHSYSIPSGPLRYCMLCKSFFPDLRENKEYDIVKMPPVIYQITKKRWEQVAPWPLIPFEVAEEHGWYITMMKSDEYLVMPIQKDGVDVFYSARRLTDFGGDKYRYPLGVKKEYWTSGELKSPVIMCEGVADAAYSSLVSSSIAILGSYYNGSLDDALRGHHVAICLDGDAIGILAAMRISTQLKTAKTVKIVILPEGKDPTDFDIVELAERIMR